MEKNSVFSHIKAILIAPFNVTVVIPLLILYFSQDMRFGWGLGVGVVPGAFFLLAGLALLAKTIKLFKKIGKGTLLPIDPTQKLVVVGPYQHVRNPMYCGVFSILAGEAILFGSLYLLGWFLLFSLFVHFFILLYEEPGLVKRFGEEYIIYRENVPRWIPRLSPWTGRAEKDSAANR